MLPEVVACLACPQCGQELASLAHALRCPQGHSFDLAGQGYVNLLGGDKRGASGDTAAMVAARAKFLSAGHYVPLTAALAEASLGAPPGPVLDLGAGTGYHLAALLGDMPARVGVALDSSRYAARRAARSHPRAGAVVADTWAGLPIRPGSMGLVICVFSPRNGAETARVLKPGGRLVVVTPGPGHLKELIEPMGLLRVDELKDRRLAEALEPHLDAIDRTEHEWHMPLSGPEVAAVAAMGPSGHHHTCDELAGRAGHLARPLQVTAHVKVSTYRFAG